MFKNWGGMERRAMDRRTTGSEGFLYLFILDLAFYCAIPMLYPMDTSGG